MICEIYREKWTFSWQKSSAKGRHCETTPETSRKHPEGNPCEKMQNLQIFGKRTVDFRTFRKITAKRFQAAEKGNKPGSGPPAADVRSPPGKALSENIFDFHATYRNIRTRSRKTAIPVSTGRNRGASHRKRAIPWVFVEIPQKGEANFYEQSR